MTQQPTFAAIGLGGMSRDQRREFVNALSADIDTPPAISPEFLAELERRAEHCRLHPEDTIPGEQVFAELLAEFGK